MPVYICDSSAIIKGYVQEIGSAYIENIIRNKDDTIVVAKITKVEVVAALSRRFKNETSSQRNIQHTIQLFLQHFDKRYYSISVSSLLIDQATILARKYALRGYDAVQLAVAVHANLRYQRNTQESIIFVSADNELNHAAIQEGLSVENPNNYS
ncbi:MAG: type II toxin-antitoxin system VapC family toxin [Herpetosiphon sp.]|nr:type II toxin-antitoxin system VapC family toxin [Herpetosiphon sp.]